MADKSRPPEPDAERNPRSRRFTLIWAGVAVVFVVGVLFVYLASNSKEGDKSKAQRAPHMDKDGKQIQTTPARASTMRAVARENTRRARRSGQSYVPAPVKATAIKVQTGDSSLQLGLHPTHPTAQQRPQTSQPTQPVVTSRPAPVRPQTPRVSPRKKKVAKLTKSIKGEFNHIAGWDSASPAKTIVAERKTDTQSNGHGVSGARPTPPPTGSSAGNARAIAQAPGLKPGDVLYAVEDMKLNSDSPGPAEATVVTGPYKGSKALGGFSREGGRMVVKFTTLTTPAGMTYHIKGYAVDPKTNSTAVRSDVDHHYLARWGGLIASSFLTGLGRAVAMGGSTTITSNGGTVTTHPELDLNKQLIVAGGQVGEAAGRELHKGFNRPPTVTLDAGEDLGILVISARGGQNQ
jgi:type IV secretory pathway VirB10-like protein